MFQRYMAVMSSECYGLHENISCYNIQSEKQDSLDI